MPNQTFPRTSTRLKPEKMTRIPFFLAFFGLAGIWRVFGGYFQPLGRGLAGLFQLIFLAFLR